MDELKLPQDDRDKPKGRVTNTRLYLWIAVGAFGAYLLISGIIGIVSGGTGG